MMGIEATLIDAGEVNAEEIKAISNLGCVGLAASSKSLTLLMRRSPRPDQALQSVLSAFGPVLFYGFEAEVPEDQALLARLSGSPPVHLIKVAGGSQAVSFTKQLPAACSQLRELSFAAPGIGANRSAFEPGRSAARSDTLMTVGGAPLLVRIDRGQEQLFLLSS
ncbi:MAG TPA: hypothetical protein VNF29_04425, partial [Candidatus Binataceae bacterium]|nr:hypothetical protein [Candidatus Binataceae bacterium]